MRLILALILTSTSVANADVIISGVYKRGTGAKETNNNSSSVITKDTKGVITKSEGSNGSNSSFSSTDNFGVLIQGIASDIALGAGVFQDQTVLLTLGVRFK